MTNKFYLYFELDFVQIPQGRPGLRVDCGGLDLCYLHSLDYVSLSLLWLASSFLEPLVRREGLLFAKVYCNRSKQTQRLERSRYFLHNIASYPVSLVALM